MMKATFSKSKSSNPKKLKKKFQKQKCYSKNDERKKKKEYFSMEIFFSFFSSLFSMKQKQKIAVQKKKNPKEMK